MFVSLVLVSLLTNGSADAATQANLRVKKLVVKPASSSVTLTVTVENSGGTAVTGCWMDVFATAAKVPSAGDDGDATAWVGSIAAGGTRSVSVTVSGWTADPAVLPDYVYIVIDSDKGVSESSETDNVVGQGIGVDARGAFTTSSLSFKAQVPDILNCPSCEPSTVCPDCGTESAVCIDCGYYPTTTKALTVHCPGLSTTAAPTGWSQVGWDTGDPPPF